MNFPVYLKLGAVSLHPHWVFDVLAYATGIWLLTRRRRRVDDVVDTRTRWIVVAAALFGGVIGSHLLFVLEDLALLRSSAPDPMLFLAGKTIVGGLIGGLIAVEFVKARLGIVVATGDLLVLPLAAGISIGRIGCFLTGLSDGTSGIATSLPWGVDFGDGIPRHPTQLYEIAFVALLSLLVTLVAPRLHLVGDAFKLFLLGYLSFRVLVDFIKPATRIAGVSVLQWACLAVIAYYAPHVPRLIAEVRRG
jgi:phosphatidylglycerol---prolipoprotein diacylglyceryl transferase